VAVNAILATAELRTAIQSITSRWLA